MSASLVPSLDQALTAARAALRGAEGTTEDALRDLVEAVDHRRGTLGSTASRLLRARDGDEDARETALEDAVALAEGVLAAAPEMPRLMGTKEACAVLGVKAPNLRKVAGLPAPVAELASGPVWAAEQIELLAARRRAGRE